MEAGMDDLACHTIAAESQERTIQVRKLLRQIVLL